MESLQRFPHEELFEAWNAHIAGTSACVADLTSKERTFKKLAPRPTTDRRPRELAPRRSR
jgi:hypothetical protein